MARTRNIQERADGSLFYSLTRSRTIEIPGTKGLELSETVQVPQVNPEGSLDAIVMDCINLMDGKTDEEKVEKFVSAFNSGLIADAQVKIQSKLNKGISENQVVSDFSQIVKLAGSMLPDDLEDSERTEVILERFPEWRKKLADAGVKLGDGSVTETEIETK